MVSAKIIVLVALVAAAYAEEERVKKDVILGTVPYAYSPLPYAYSAYEKAVIAPSYHVPAAYHVPSTYAALPAVSAYSVPYAYSHYPYVKSVIY